MILIDCQFDINNNKNNNNNNDSSGDGSDDDHHHHQNQNDHHQLLFGLLLNSVGRLYYSLWMLIVVEQNSVPFNVCDVMCVCVCAVSSYDFFFSINQMDVDSINSWYFSAALQLFLNSDHFSA